MIGNEIVDIKPKDNPEKWDQIDLGLDYIPKDPNEPRSVVLFNGQTVPYPEEGSEKPSDKDDIIDIVPIPAYEVTMENYQEKMPVGVFKMEAGLVSQAGYVYEQMQKTRRTSEVLDSYLLNNKKIDKLTPLERIELYKTINKNLEIGI